MGSLSYLPTPSDRPNQSRVFLDMVYPNICTYVLENQSDTYSGKCALYVDVFAEDKCAKTYRVQIYIPKADFNGEFSFEMGENQTVHSFEAEALSGACGMGGTFWTYTVFGADEQDAE